MNNLSLNFVVYDKFSLYLITAAVIYHLLFVITITISCKYFYNSLVIWQKGKSQNGCFKKTKHPKFSEKTNISYPLIRKRTCEYQGVNNVVVFFTLSLLFLKNVTVPSFNCVAPESVFYFSKNCVWLILIPCYFMLLI